MPNRFNRRHFLTSAAALGAGLLARPLRASPGKPSAAHIVVVGGGFAGATCARYLRMWSGGRVAVTLIEKQPRFVSCPLSNLVITGHQDIEDISLGYDRLAQHWGVRLLHDEVLAIDPIARRVSTRSHGRLDYDRLVLAPGIDFIPGGVPGHDPDDLRFPHAWRAGEQTLALRAQLAALADGGVFAIHIPRAPLRCPPGPYERACLVADYLRRHKPRSKLLVLDANSEIQSKKALFSAEFARYAGLLEYRPNSVIDHFDPANRSLELEFERVRADVFNIIPPMRAARIAQQSGLPLINERWVDVDWLSLEARGMAGIHVLGDALFPAPGMPKSGHMANQHGKLAAAAILNLVAGHPPSPAPVVMNTCYSFVDGEQAVHVASVHQYDALAGQPLPVDGAGGVSAAPSMAEAAFARAWARNIWADMLG